MQKSQSFTVSYNRIANVLITKATILPAFDPKKVDPLSVPKGEEYNAIWDTGATNTVVTKKVVSDLGLKPIGMTKVHGVGGVIDSCPTYLANITLPHGVSFVGFRVTEGNLSNDINILIGMDIISNGDFAISNLGGKTKFSFRVPSIESIDFVKQHNSKANKTTQKVGRNAQCPCGSGKKYKKCCGKTITN